MASVRFNLRNKKDEKSLIVLIFRHQGKRIVASTQQTILVENWNSKTQRPKSSARFPLGRDLNLLLDKLEEVVISHYRTQLLKTQSITKESLKEEVQKVLGKREYTLLGFIDIFIKERMDSGKYKKDSLKPFRIIKNHLKQYCKVKKKSLDFDDLTVDFFYSFTKYLNEKNLSKNYQVWLINYLKSILIQATEVGINTNMAYKSKKVSVKKEAVENIYLSQEELTKIIACDFSDKQKLDRTRDLFLIGCFTGLRFSDYSQIKSENITQVNGIEALKINPQKT